MSDLKFCPQCGAALVGTKPLFCASCGSRVAMVDFTQEPVGQGEVRAGGERSVPTLGEENLESAHQADIPVWEGRALMVGSDIPFGLYRATMAAESHSSTGTSIQVVNGCDPYGYGLFLADQRSTVLEVSGDGLLIPIANMPSWDPLPVADDLIMGACLVGVDIPPGRYQIDPYDGQGSTGQASRLDARLNSLSDHGFDSPSSDVPTLVDVRETDFALQFYGRPRLLN